MKKKLDLDEMKELLTDYAFNKLTTNEALIFENNLKDYPEIEEEIVEIRNAFSKVNKDIIRENLQKKTANLTYKIKLKQYELDKNKTARKNILKFAFPILVVVALFLVLRQIQFKDNDIPTNKEDVLLSKTDTDIIIGDATEISYYDPYFNTFYNLSNKAITKNENIDFISNSSNIVVYNYLNEISEAEFKQLLDEMDNEKFNL